MHHLKCYLVHFNRRTKVGSRNEGRQVLLCRKLPRLSQAMFTTVRVFVSPCAPLSAVLLLSAAKGRGAKDSIQKSKQVQHRDAPASLNSGIKDF